MNVDTVAAVVNTLTCECPIDFNIDLEFIFMGCLSMYALGLGLVLPFKRAQLIPKSTSPIFTVIAQREMLMSLGCPSFLLIKIDANRYNFSLQDIAMFLLLAYSFFSSIR